MFKYISSNIFKYEITDKQFICKYMHIHLNVCQQITDVELLQMHSNTCNYFTVWKHMYK